MRRSKTLLILALASFFVLPSLASPPSAAARSWVGGRNFCMPRLLSRYYGMLNSANDFSWALSRILRCTSLKALITKYEGLVKANQASYPYRVILGGMYLKAKEWKQGVAVLKQAASMKPKGFIAHYRLGEAYRKLKKPALSQQSYEKSLSLVVAKRVKKRILRNLIDLTIATRTLQKARDYFKKLIALDPSNPTVRHEFAQMLTRNLLYAEAIKEYQALIKRYRGNSAKTAMLLRDLGFVYEKKGQDPEAKKSYLKAMRYLTRNHWLRKGLIHRIIAIHRRKNDLRSLIAEWERKWQGRGNAEWSILGALYDEIGEDTKAISAYRRALAVDRRDIDTRSKLIRLLDRLNKHKEAIQELEALVRIEPYEARFRLELAQKLWGQRQRARALLVLRRLGVQFGRDPSVHLALADYYNKWGKPDLALREYQILVRIEPGDHGHLINLGEQYWQRGNRRMALATWARLLRHGLMRSREDAYATLARVYAEHDLGRQAIDYYNRAIRLNPKSPGHHRGLAMVLQKSKRYSDAVDTWQKVIKLATKKRHQSWRREARTQIISIWHRRRKLQSKLVIYRRRFNARPPDISAGYFMGEAYLKLKRGKEAEAVYRRVLQIDPKQVEALLALEQIYREGYNLRKAVAMLQRLLKVLPKRAREWWGRMAVLYLQLMEDAKAIAAARKVVELSKNDALGWARLGSIYEKKEDFDHAVKAYKKALELNNRMFKIHFSLARIYLQLGNHVAAGKLYHEVIKRSPDEDFVQRAARRALVIDEYLGSLFELERELIPLAFTYTNKKVYRKSLVELYARLVPPLAFDAQFGPTSKRRRRARQLLDKIGERALKPLLEALSEKQGTQRDIALDVLGHIGNRNAAPPLVRLALEPPPTDDITSTTSAATSVLVRRRTTRTRRKTSAHVALKVRAIVAAGRLRDPRTAPDLIKLVDDSDVEIREAVTWALSYLKNRAAIRALTTALGDRKIGVQIFACVGLGRQGVAQVMPLLLGVVRDRARRREVRSACAYALGLTGDRDAVKVLLGLLREGRGELQVKAAWALGLLGSREAVRPLADLLWTRRGQLRRAIAWALLRSTAGTIYADKSPVRIRVVDGRVDYESFLKHLGPPQDPISVAQVVKLLAGSGTELARALDTALERHRDLVLSVLTELNAHPTRLGLAVYAKRTPNGVVGSAGEKATIRRQVEAALAPIAAVLRKHLARLTRHRDREIRIRSLELVAKVDHGQVVKLIRGGLGDSDGQVRRAAGRSAVIAARRQGARRGELVRVMIAGLDKLPWFEQLERIRWLGELRARSALPTLQPFSRRSHGFLAQAAVWAMGQIRARSSVPHLVRALAYPAGKVRIEAIRALVGVLGVGARSHLRTVAAKDKSAEVRRVAREALAKLSQ